MGCSSSVFTAYTLEETEAEIAKSTPCLPVAELMNGGIIKLYSPSERPMREHLKTQAGLAAVQELNERYKSVRFNYQQTADNMQIDTAQDPNPLIRYAQRNKLPIGNTLTTVLYITFN